MPVDRENCVGRHGLLILVAMAGESLGSLGQPWTPLTSAALSFYSPAPLTRTSSICRSRRLCSFNYYVLVLHVKSSPAPVSSVMLFPPE